MDAPTTPDERQKRPYIHPAALRLFIGVGLVIVVGLLSILGWNGYKTYRQQRVMTRAREFFEKKDYGQAAMALQWALTINPHNIEAARLLAETAERGGSRDVVQLRRSVASLEPREPKNYINWANIALRKGDVVNARLAVEGMRDAGLLTAAYYDASARVADASGEPEKIEAAMAEAVRLEPKNSLYRLRLASMRVGSATPGIRDEALATVEELTTDPVTRRTALRVLLYHSLATRNTAKSVEVAERLRRAPESLFEDRLVYLGIMHRAARWEFWWDLADLEADTKLDAFHVTETLRWLVRTGLAEVAVDWGQRLPNERRLRAPVAIALAEALTIRHDWEGLRPLVKAGEWGDLDFQRHALLARVLREQGDEPGSRAQWSAAVTAASDRTEAQETLLGLTTRWKWNDERTTLLWVIARGRNEPKTALNELLRAYFAGGRTRELLSVFSRFLELDPKDAEAKNNVAYASLLLNADPKRAQTLAAEAYRADPSNAGFAATYGYALYVAGKHPEGRKIIETIPEHDRKVPANALSCALLFAATGAPEEARKYLAVAEAGRLLPEEKALLTKVRAKLGAK